MIKIYDGRDEFYQWDLDRQIVVSDLIVDEVHFCNKTSDCSLVVAVYEKDGLRLADVPNILLQTDWPIYVYAYCGDCYTKESATFKVNRRSRPDDYVYTETEVKRWEDLEKRVDDKITQLDVSEGDRVAAEEARAAAEEAREAAEVERAETFSNLTNEAGVLIDVLDNYYVPTVDNHEIRITNMERHISNDYFFTDEAVEYNKVVPADACPYAEVGKIGGMTYKCNNLIPFPYNYEVGYEHKLNGVTFTVQEDGGISVVGIAEKNTMYTIKSYPDKDVLNLQQGKQYIVSGGVSGISIAAHITPIEGDIVSTVWLESNTSNYTKALPNGYRFYRAILYVSSGVEINTVVYPMINEGSTALPYEPYFEGLRDAAVSALESEGANLIPFPYRKPIGHTETINGVTFTLQEDGGISVVGTATKDVSFSLHRDVDNHPFLRSFVGGKTYTISGGKGYVVVNARTQVDGESTTYSWIESNVNKPGAQTKVFPEGRILQTIGLFIANGKTVNEVVYPMLNEGSTALLYKPYRGTIDTLEIAEEIQALDGYGRGVEGYPNYFDFERKVFRQNTYRKVFDGTEICVAVTSNTSGKYRIAYTATVLDVRPLPSPNGSVVMPTICTHYDSVNGDKTYTLNRGVCIGTGSQIIFYDEAYNTSDVSLWKAHLAELYANGNPLIVEYALAEPIETDISAYLGNENIIEVEGGGLLRAINEYNNPAPTSITYLLKEGSV